MTKSPAAQNRTNLAHDSELARTRFHCNAVHNNTLNKNTVRKLVVSSKAHIRQLESEKPVSLVFGFH